MQVTDEMIDAATVVMRQRSCAAPEQHPEKETVRLMLEAAYKVWWDGIIAASGGHADEARRLPAA